LGFKLLAVNAKPRGPVKAFLPTIVWRASQCGWLRIGKTEHGHDVWEKPNGQQMIIRAGAEPHVPVRGKRGISEAPKEMLSSGAPGRVHWHSPPRLTEAHCMSVRSGFLVQRTTAALTRIFLLGIDSARLRWKGVNLGRRQMPGDPKECRQHALTCARLAVTSASPLVREQFANLTNTWLNLADDLERTLALLETSDDEDEHEKLTG
jgi:hypothetical protein